MSKPKSGPPAVPVAKHPRVLYVAEPAAGWSVQPPVVVDCSVVAALLWGEPAAGEARALMSARSLHAPGLLPYELANVARSKVRAGVPQAVARDGLAAFDDRRITLHEPELDLVFDTAERHGLSAYDAAYLTLAAALQAPLVTFDRRLADAAARELGPRE